MFSISKAFRIFSLVLAAVLVPAMASAGTTGPTDAKQTQHEANGKGKLKPAGKRVLKGAKIKKSKGKMGHRPKLLKQKEAPKKRA